ncbi:MAG TPA: GreA/GreB family elongation factor [Candidatus Paceibacterota bacterium]|uniref:Transcription elongation factor GreA/GreB C-terminal domain-containing protein n=1 Tax=Candidatus Liptonbacteria bacterium RIFCSPLOWO2_01_FULL_56_20 TaxID=1798652 RepID=A0A1G2CK55_9BACT|nr:MAG: hypothetical protein A2681_01655 [Candidatus Liptonbacteria bacterium RIFCSPHIGHO2_01_FULL_56_18b]OGZ01110.1 MAG: hypothetical protein A3A43_00515 [Candidatus Liptonbacteria bacterium RIFCSPLOWO2_01_FULL_56_20]
MSDKSKILLTKQGLHHLREEVKKLERKYAEISKTKMEAAEQGGNLWHDNPAFEEVETLQLLLGKQIADIKEKIRQAVLVSGEDESKGVNVVAIGSKTKMSFSDGRNKEITIAGYAESNPEKGIISYQSPLGQAVLGAKAGETKEYQVGNKVIKVKIESVSPPS